MMMILRYVVALLVAVSVGTLFYVRQYQPIPPSEQMKNLDYTFKSKEYNDVVFIGSSRVLRQINPIVFDSISGLKSYSLGIDQIGIIECKMLINSYLQYHQAPKMVVLNIDLSRFMFNTDSEGPYNIDEYLPYLDNDLIYNELSRYNWRYRYVKLTKFLYGFYPIQKLMVQNDSEKRERLLHPNRTIQPDSTIFRNRGFIANDANWNTVAEEELRQVNRQATSETPVTAEGFKLLEEFCQVCQRKNIKLTLLFTPWFSGIKKNSNHDEVLEKVAQIATKHQAVFKDYTGISISQSKDYFYDCWHFNLKGAYQYSAILARDLPQLLH